MKKMNKTCSKCGEVKPIGDFRKERHQYKYSLHQWKIRPECKVCAAKYIKQWRQDNEEYSKQWYHANKHTATYKKRYKKIKKKYRQNLPAATYSITNTINGKVYIGQSTQYSRRWTTHKRNLRKNKHENKHFQQDWNEYGEDAFVFEVIEELPPDTSSELLLEKEREQIIEHLKRDVILYNTLN